MKSKDFLNEKWSKKYKKSINCSSPKGFSQRAHCAGRKKNESVELDEIDRRGFLKGLGAAALAGAGGTAAAGDLERDIGPLPIMATIKVQLRNGEIVTRKIDLGHEYDYRLDDAKKDIEKMLDAKGVKNYTIHLDRYKDNSAYLDREQMKPQAKTDKNDYMDRKPYQPKGGSGSYVDNSPLTPKASGKHNYMDPANYESVQEADAELAEPPERPRKTTTKTKTKPDIKFDIPFQQDQDQPLAKTDPLDDIKKKAGIGDEPKVNIRKAKQKDTLSKTAGIGSDDMADMLGKLRNIEVDRDLEAYPDEEPPEQLPSVEVNTANLPAVAGQALQAAGVQDPEFHQVANLPGNMADQIRQLGKSLFGSLTMTPTKRIHVVANLGGQGPNSSAEVNAVAGFLKDHGRDLGPGDIDFENVMPGYKAQTHMFSAAGIRWMLVKDFAGQYIYCWPEEDSHDAQDAIGMDKDVKKLK